MTRVRVNTTVFTPPLDELSRVPPVELYAEDGGTTTDDVVIGPVPLLEMVDCSQPVVFSSAVEVILPPATVVVSGMAGDTTDVMGSLVTDDDFSDTAM